MLPQEAHVPPYEVQVPSMEAQVPNYFIISLSQISKTYVCHNMPSTNFCVENQGMLTCFDTLSR